MHLLVDADPQDFFCKCELTQIAFCDRCIIFSKTANRVEKENMFTYVLDKQNAKALWSLSPLFCQLLS